MMKLWLVLLWQLWGISFKKILLLWNSWLGGHFIGWSIMWNECLNHNNSLWIWDCWSLVLILRWKSGLRGEMELSWFMKPLLNGPIVSSFTLLSFSSIFISPTSTLSLNPFFPHELLLGLVVDSFPKVNEVCSLLTTALQTFWKPFPTNYLLNLQGIAFLGEVHSTINWFLNSVSPCEASYGF